MRVFLINTGDLAGSVELVGDMCAARHAYAESSGHDVIIFRDPSMGEGSEYELRSERRVEPSVETGVAAERGSGSFVRAEDISGVLCTDTKPGDVRTGAVACHQVKAIP